MHAWPILGAGLIVIVSLVAEEGDDADSSKAGKRGSSKKGGKGGKGAAAEDDGLAAPTPGKRRKTDVLADEFAA